eukprot:5105-Heterococcus_DN1.PRE.1
MLTLSLVPLQLDYRDEALLAVLPAAVSQHLAVRGVLSQQELCNTAWSLAVLDVTAPQLIHDIFHQLQASLDQ